MRKKLPPRNNPEIGSEIPRLRSGDFLQGAGLQGAAGQTVRRTVSAGEARRPRLRRGGLRPSPPLAPARRKPHHAPASCACLPQAAALPRSGSPLPLRRICRGRKTGRSPFRLRRNKAGSACFHRLRRWGCAPSLLPLSANFSRRIDKSPPTCYNGTNNCYYLRRNRL